MTSMRHRVPVRSLWKLEKHALAIRRTRLFSDQGGLCAYCSCAMVLILTPGQPPPLTYATFDHVIPESKGGTWEQDNIVLACWACNSEKGDRSVEEFLEARRVRAQIAARRAAEAEAKKARKAQRAAPPPEFTREPRHRPPAPVLRLIGWPAGPRTDVADELLGRGLPVRYVATWTGLSVADVRRRAEVLLTVEAGCRPPAPPRPRQTVPAL